MTKYSASDSFLPLSEIEFLFQLLNIYQKLGLRKLKFGKNNILVWCQSELTETHSYRFLRFIFQWLMLFCSSNFLRDFDHDPEGHGSSTNPNRDPKHTLPVEEIKPRK